MPVDPPITPLAIGPANSERALGVSWRWVRDFARSHGVPVWRTGSKTLIPVGPLLAALERAGAPAEPARELDPRAELARRLAS